MNKRYIGIILGLVLPMITIWALYTFSYGAARPWNEFIEALIRLQSMATMIAIACLSNLAVFTFFAYTDKLEISRGLIISTILWAVAIVIIKFFVQ
ncbi:MAG: hypothetical protein MJZ31_03650 [Bacteroidales bacterium]|nr:hypothetical protein [Bacteroidales bacterium]